MDSRPVAAEPLESRMLFAHLGHEVPLPEAAFTNWSQSSVDALNARPNPTEASHRRAALGAIVIEIPR